jgi:hypothetical protein
MFLRPDGSPRNPYSFCPFFGGKRICLGKTLAESMTVYTIPLIMYHFAFEYVNPDHLKVKPNFQLASPQMPTIPMRLKYLNKVQKAFSYFKKNFKIIMINNLLPKLNFKKLNKLVRAF